MTYLKEEQETIINILEESGDIIMYSCSPKYIEKMMIAADKFNIPIKLRDVIDGYPQAVEIQIYDLKVIEDIIVSIDN